MVLAPAKAASKTTRKSPALLDFWRSTIGKKVVMAVTGLLMVAFLLAHMVGNLKIFFGPAEFDAYSAWLRTIGGPVLHHEWYLWIQRTGLLIALVLHITAAAQLSRRDRKARPVRYVHSRRPRATFATRTMRWGGVIIAFYVVWHVLDLTVGAVHPGFVPHHPYQNVVTNFQVWWINLIYFVPVILVGLHINHGFFSAAQTLGVHHPARRRALKITGSALAFVITAGFLLVPIAVMTGMVE
ncbi:succinate dehydrogenase cytochrome b subunit [Amycolatopsis sp. 195334CR]|uniref:succinate dehydrogenase cytochrome b subunit n=1 Tax=Amycolatopsis sp. 195334CR TaxID=2814588 RepID=UPI0027DEA263|nr:succinate dehydrogenase cytochrome b subunit [Amycolatopsis sp. 195334CR]